MGSLRGTALCSRSFFHWLNPHCFLQPEVVETSLWHWNMGLGSWCGAGIPCSWDIPLKFLSTSHGCRNSPFHTCTLPTSMDEYVYFLNFIVVRLPFNSISDGSESWPFYILVVILMWLSKDSRNICLHCHLGRKLTLWLLTVTFLFNNTHFT